ncbi:hypothetical protein F442_06283, partial [Phytophthora nicotianae P10297]
QALAQVSTMFTQKKFDLIKELSSVQTTNSTLGTTSEATILEPALHDSQSVELEDRSVSLVDQSEELSVDLPATAIAKSVEMMDLPPSVPPVLESVLESVPQSVLESVTQSVDLADQSVELENQPVESVCQSVTQLTHFS